MKRLFLAAVFFAFTPCLAHAETLHALSMHDEPAYAPGFTHLDTANPAAPKGGTLSQAAIGSFDTLNPFTLKGTAPQGMNLVHDRLMERNWDEPFSLYPLIAEKVDVPKDRSSIIFHLNPKARFSDGSPITSADVNFSFNVLRDHGRANMRRVYKLVKKVTTPGAHTIRFDLGDGYDRETIMILAMMPVLSFNAWAERDFDKALTDTPVTSGPYRVASFDMGRRIVYERIAGHWAADLPIRRGFHNFDRVAYDYFRDDTVAFQAFRAGTLNVRREYDLATWATDYNFPALTSGTVTKDSIAHRRPERVNAVIFNLRRPLFADLRVRQALSMMLDFEWINRAILFGQGKRIRSFFPNTDLAHTPEDPLPDTITRDVQAKAAALLADAGWVVKGGQRVNRDTGAPLRFEILLATPDDEKIALVFANALKKLGVTATLRTLDTSAYRNRLNDYDFDATISFWNTSLSPGSEQLLYWSCEAARQPARLNYAGVCDPNIDTLAKNVADTPSRADLVKTVKDLDARLYALHFAVPLHYIGADLFAYAATLKRPAQTPLYGTMLENWWHEPAPSGGMDSPPVR